MSLRRAALLFVLLAGTVHAQTDSLWRVWKSSTQPDSARLQAIQTLAWRAVFERPDSGIAHPGVDAPFGIYPTEDGWVTIAMSPYRKLIGVLEAPELLEYEKDGRLYSERDEVWRRIAALTIKWK